MNRILGRCLALTCTLLLGCAGGGVATSDSGPNWNWPSSITGYQIHFIVEDPQTSGLPAGSRIVWSFSGANQAQGRNPVSGVVYTPDYYSYSAGGGTATIRFTWNMATPTGLKPYEEYHLTAATSTTGSYEYIGDTGYGQGQKTSVGRYEILGTDTPPPTTGQGQVCFWSSYGTGGSITVQVDGSTVGTLNSYFQSTPAFGQSGTVTKTLTTGSHSFSAKSQSNATWSGTLSITEGCKLMYQLQGPSSTRAIAEPKVIAEEVWSLPFSRDVESPEAEPIILP